MSNYADVFTDLAFPGAGIDVSAPYGRQPVRPLPNGGHARTTPSATNVRHYEPTTNRARGAQRHGLAKYINAQVNGTALIQGLNVVSGVGYSAPGGGVQTSQSGRVVTLCAFSGGTMKVADAGATTWTSVTGGTGCVNSSGIVSSAANGQKLWIVDGTNSKVYDPATNAVSAWTATAGTFPVDSAGNKPRHICTWRGRTVLSGLLKDPANWFLSRVGDPRDFDYSPVSPSADQAVAGNNSTLGLVGDVITGLIPFNDDILIFGGDHSLWALRGDPMHGGQLDLISDAIGMAWGEAWCRDPHGTLYFISNRLGIYAMEPGSAPVRISQAIESLLADVNTGTNTVRCLYDDRAQGFHVFITRTASAAATTHYYYERRSGSWWQDSFGNNNHNPLCCTTFDGNTATDRVGLVGSWDGYVRYFKTDATNDDGTTISSSVVIGPLVSKDMDELLCKDVQAVLATGSGSVTYAIHVGATAEEALSSTAVVTGTWAAGRNVTTFVRRSGHAIYVKLSATSPWAMEQIRARLAARGKVRRRGKGN